MLKAHVKVKCTSQSQRSLEQLLPGSSHFSRAMYEEDPGDEVATWLIVRGGVVTIPQCIASH